MFCVMCGKQIEPDTSFCVHCGHKFNAAPPPEPLRRRSWIPFILIFTFTSVISLGILVWALFYEDTSSYSSDIVGRWVCSTDEGFGTYWIFNNDNTCVYYVPEMYGNVRTGYTDTLDSRYRISGNMLTFTHSDGVSANWRISINGDELKLYMSDGQLFDIYWKDRNYHVQSLVFQSQPTDSNSTNDKITLGGILSALRFQQSNGDWIETYVLELDNPENITADGEMFNNVTEVQVTFKDADYSTSENEGKHVEITGTPMWGFNASYVRDVVLYDSSLELSDLPTTPGADLPLNGDGLLDTIESDTTKAMRESDPELFDAMFGSVESEDGNNDDNPTNNKQATSESDTGIDSEILKRAL